MPNGGILPGCFTCKWVEREDDLQIDAYCRRHSMMVYSAVTTFCPDLSSDSTPRISDAPMARINLSQGLRAPNPILSWGRKGRRSIPGRVARERRGR